MKKKLVTILCVTTITASMLAGCGSKTAETTAPTETTAVTETAAATEAATTEAASETAAATEAEDDQAAADKVAALIDAIYVQERNENTDEQCKEAKEAWDALTDAQKELVEGEEADPDYFGRDTGDASKDDPRNGDEIGENELLVVSFGTSFNDSRVADIKGIEDALQAANPDWSVRRAFTAQIIINHIQARDDEHIDNMDQALERAVNNGVKNLVIQPTHLMHGAEYDELMDAVDAYKDKFESVKVAEPLLGEVGDDADTVNDDKKAVAIAGVMGGLNSEITEKTNTVVFESAVFNGGNIRKTAKKVGLRTESSSRFEKGLSSENALRAINRAVELVELLKAGKAIDGKIDVYPTKQKINKIPLEVERINNLLGIKLSKQEMIDILEKLDIKVENDMAIAPYFRMDLEFVADIAEEILRFYGYDKLNTTLVNADTTIGIRNKEQKIQRNIREMLVNSGLSEIYTYGFVSQKDLEKSNIKEELRKSVITIKNPLSDEYKFMRPTTVPSMMQILANNANKKNQNVKLFDISRNYRNLNNEIEKGEVPLQEDILTIGMYGDNIDFYTLKGLIENVLEKISVNRYDIEKETNNASYHPGRCANLKVGNDVIATIGEVHPEVLQNYDIEKRVYLAEVNVTKLVKYSRENKKYVEVPKFPAVERDIAMIVDEKVEVGQIEKIITKKGKKLLESVKLFDIYRDEKLGENKKSVAYSLIFRDKNKTLNDEEINNTMENIITELQKTLGAELRV